MPRKSTKTVARKPAKDADQKVSENLRKIYENPDGSMPDMSTISRQAGGQWWRVLLRSAAVLGCIAVGMWIWDTQIKPRLYFQNELAVDLTGPAAVAPGATAQYTVRYRNPGTSEIKEATLYLEHPSEFMVLSSSKPLSVNGSKIVLGSLRGNEGGEVTVTGLWAADFATTSTLRALLSYTPANFSSVFEKESSLDVATSESAIKFAWTTPAAVSVGKKTSLGLTISAPAVFATGTRLQLLVPSEFSLSASEPTNNGNIATEWVVSTTTNKFTLSITGAYSATSSAPFSAVVRGFVSGTPVILAKNTQFTDGVVKESPAIQVSVLEHSDMVSAAPGTVLPIKVRVMNPEVNALTNAVVVLNITAPSYQNKSILNWEKFIDSYDGSIKGQQLSPELRRGVITWTSKEIKDLANLASGATVPFEVSIPIKSSAETNLGNFASSTIMVTAELRNGSDLIATSEPVLINITSDTVLSTKADRVDNTYIVIWLLNNTYHELTDVQIEGDLYGDFIWDEKAASVPVGKIAFDSKTKKLMWTIPKLVTSVDVAALKGHLIFAKINPTQKNLSSVIKLTATDAETGDTITLSAPAIKAP